MISFERTISLTEEDANNLISLVENMSQTAEIENKTDKTKTFTIKIEEK
jgi:hypothetical protein